jgi:amidase
MTRTVADAALLLTGMAAIDPDDPAGPNATGRVPADYTTFLKADAAKGKRIGLLRQAMRFHPAVDAATDAAADALRKLGAEVVDVKVATYNDWNDAEFQVLLYEFKDGLNTYLKNSGAPHPSLEALIAFNRANADRVMPFFGQEIFEQAQAKGPLTDAEYVRARESAKRLAGKDGLIEALDTNKLDAILAPSMSPAWPTDHVLGDHFLGAGYGMAAVAGTPSISVPAGETFGLPIGVTLMGRPYSEGELLGFAFALEQATRSRKAPQFTATLH